MARHAAIGKWAFASAAGMATLVLALHVVPGWACVPQPLINLQPNASGPAGSQVTVNGLALGQGTVEVRWNAVDGPLLAQGTGPTVSGSITIPETADGLYSVIAFNRGPDGTVGSTGRASFEVRAPGAPAGEASSPSTTRAPVQVRSGGGSNAAVTVLVGLAALAVGLAAGVTVTKRWRTREVVAP